MKRDFLRWLLLAMTVAALGTAVAGAQPRAIPALVGRWTGTTGEGPDRLRLVVEIQRAADGRLIGTVSGVDQGSPYAIDAIQQRGMTVTLVVGVVSGSFEGVLSDDGTKLTGAWSQIAIATPLELIRSPVNR